jgi:hypothetical protein
MLTHILLGLGLLAGWALFLAASPTRRCRRCKGKRIVRSRWRQRIIACPKCRTTGRHYRLGAVTVHRFINAARAERDGQAKEDSHG